MNNVDSTLMALLQHESISLGINYCFTVILFILTIKSLFKDLYWKNQKNLFRFRSSLGPEDVRYNFTSYLLALCLV